MRWSTRQKIKFIETRLYWERAISPLVLKYILRNIREGNAVYIEFVNRDENIDFDKKIAGLQAEFTDLLKAEESSKKELLSVFKGLGYEIKL